MLPQKIFNSVEETSPIVYLNRAVMAFWTSSAESLIKKLISLQQTAVSSQTITLLLRMCKWRKSSPISIQKELQKLMQSRLNLSFYHLNNFIFNCLVFFRNSNIQLGFLLWKQFILCSLKLKQFLLAWHKVIDSSRGVSFYGSSLLSLVVFIYGML